MKRSIAAGLAVLLAVAAACTPSGSQTDATAAATRPDALGQRRPLRSGVAAARAHPRGAGDRRGPAGR